VYCVPVRLLTESAAQESAAELKNETPERNNEDNQERKTQTTAGHKLKRHFAPARRSAHLEFQRLNKDFHVLESPPVLGSQLLKS
jgi:hypothetical protein